jgi:DNA (cytosine-5)-methyltransferase 1
MGKEKGLTFIDFFSGIGGFRLGMEMAGHECVGHCECDPYCDTCKKITTHNTHLSKKHYTVCSVCGREKRQHAVISYHAMHNVKEGEWYANDITRVNPGELPEADCYCGGFPCQAFSIAGKRGGFADTRGTLFFEVMRLARERKPKYLFLENVAGLLSHDNGNTFATIIQSFADSGYDVQWQILNSKDFGVPQNRERVFFIGHLRGQRRPEVFPLRGTSGETLKELTVGLSDAFRVYDPSGLSKTLKGEAGGQGAKTGLYLLNGTREGNTYCLDANYAKGELRLDKSKRTMVEVRPVLTPDRPEKRQNGRRFKEHNEPMFTLTAQDRHGVMITDEVQCLNSKDKNGKQPPQQARVYSTNGVMTALQAEQNGRFNIHNNGRIRRLTPRECFRLQGFPDEYFERAQAVNSDSQLYKQAGNSVTINVIYEIARRLGRW